MRLLPLLALSGAAAAQQEGMMDKLSSWATNFKAQIVNSVTNPLDAGASAIAGAVVQPLSMRNWKTYLWPQENQPEEWMVYMTGRNKTCFGRCDLADRKWNQSVPLLAALPKGKYPLHLASLNCEDNEILCTAWSVGVPAVWHFIPNTTVAGTTDLHIIRLNSTTVNVEDITSIPSASTSRYLKYTPYEGIMHPIDGTLQKFGLSMPFGYLLWIMGAVPSWMMMIVISFASRQIMNKRLNENPGGLAPQGGAARPAAAGGAPPAAAAGGNKASPAGKAGSKKKR